MASFQTVDIPGADGTAVSGVNNQGVMVGANLIAQATEVVGFIKRGAQVTTLNYPGTFGASAASGISDQGTVVGDYSDASGAAHGWVRSPAGDFAQIDDPQAVTGPGTGTFVSGVNDRGEIVGFYDDANDVSHGFIDIGGTFVTVDAPGAGNASFQGTQLNGINNAGAAVGYYIDSSGATHGFVFTNGSFRAISVPGTGVEPSTLPAAISANGTITGSANSTAGTFGWLLSGSTFSAINDPNAAGLDTFPSGIDQRGDTVCGSYVSADGSSNGFIAVLRH